MDLLSNYVEDDTISIWWCKACECEYRFDGDVGKCVINVFVIKDLRRKIAKLDMLVDDLIGGRKGA
jgi:hypothetical protein